MVSVAQFGWDMLCKGFDLVKRAFHAVLDAIGSVYNAIDQKVSRCFTPAVIKQTVMLTAPYKISLAVSVVINSTADLALLKAEIAGCGLH